jgi:hypothetical protein
MRLPRPLRALVAALLLTGAAAAAAALAAPAALAQTPAPAPAPLVPSGPADGAGLTAGADPDLQARGIAGDTGIELRVSESPQVVDACGRIGADVERATGLAVAGDPGLFDFPTSAWFDTPGTYYWQVSRVAADGTCVATEVRRLVLSGAAGDPGALPTLSPERIPRRIGSTNGATFVIRTGGVPQGVSRARFLELVRNSARRWRLHSAGTRPGRVVFGNGRSEVGFSNTQVPRVALGVTIFGRRGFGGRRERDLILRADIPWQDGPAHPGRGQIDLETVILHEFGHVAGNRFHVPRGCRNTPMVVGLAPGEWWRSTQDFSYRACHAGG